MKNSLVTVGKVNTITYLNTYVNDAKYNRLLAIPVINKNNMYALYWVASPYNKSQMYYVNEIGKQDTRINCEYGVHPVVSLKPTVKTTGTDMAGRWSLEIAE